MPQVPAWGEANKPRVMEFLACLDRRACRASVRCRRPITAIADITGLVAIDLMKPAKIAVPDEFANVRRWHADMYARPSAKA